MPARRALLARAVPFLAVPAIVASASPAYAHGIGDDASDKSILEFVPVGIEHMLLGWDHLLFVAGVVLIAAEARLAAKLISLFVLGHSTTLVAATLAGWRVSPQAVDVVIALSVVFVAGVGIFGRPKSFRWFGAAVLGFGLIHGLGLSTRFQDLGIPEDGELWRVIAFNVGIEIGQLTAIAVLAAVLFLATKFIEAEKQPRAAQLACAPIFIGGSVAASLIALNAFTEVDVDDTKLAAEYAGTTGSCTLGDRTEPLPGAGGHTSKDFYEPGEEAPLGDFGHSIGDGYIALIYPTTLQDPALGELHAFVTGPDGEGVLAGATPQAGEKIIAITANKQLTCSDVDVDALTEFKTDWFASL